MKNNLKVERAIKNITQEELAKQSQERKAQIGTGDRSEKIRTYNFPDRRITDHRVGVTVYQLEKVFEGEIDEFVDALLAAEEKRIREAHTV